MKTNTVAEWIILPTENILCCILLNIATPYYYNYTKNLFGKIALFGRFGFHDVLTNYVLIETKKKEIEEKNPYICKNKHCRRMDILPFEGHSERYLLTRSFYYAVSDDTQHRVAMISL